MNARSSCLQFSDSVVKVLTSFFPILIQDLPASELIRLDEMQGGREVAKRILGALRRVQKNPVVALAISFLIEALLRDIIVGECYRSKAYSNVRRRVPQRPTQQVAKWVSSV